MNSEILDRLPPQNLDAEKGVIGSLLLDSSLFDDVAVIIRDEDFYADANRKLFGHFKAIHAVGKKLDSIILIEHLKQAGDFEAVGGAAYIAEVAQSVPIAANAVYYAKIVREKAILRNLIHAGTKIIRDAYDPSFKPDEIVHSAESRLATISTSEFFAKPKMMREIVVKALTRIEQIRERRNHVGLFTGIESLDSGIGGLFPGELFILAARPGVGKTALACQIAENVAGCGNLVLFCSLEMSDVELITRMICSEVVFRP